MDKQKQIEEMHKEYVEWALGLLKTRFDLKTEFYDEHHHDNFTYGCGAESLWGKIKSAFEELLWLRERQIPENAVVMTEEELFTRDEKIHKADREYIKSLEECINNRNAKVRKETAEKFAERLKNEVLNFCGTVEENRYFEQWKISFCEDIDEIAKEITEV